MMLYKVRTKQDLKKIVDLFPLEISTEAEHIISALDENYDNNKGGFVAIIDNELDFEELKQYHLDCNTDVYEFADILSNSGFVSVLYIVGTEFAIDVIMPISIKPANITFE